MCNYNLGSVPSSENSEEKMQKKQNIANYKIRKMQMLHHSKTQKLPIFVLVQFFYSIPATLHTHIHSQLTVHLWMSSWTAEGTNNINFLLILHRGTLQVCFFFIIVSNFFLLHIISTWLFFSHTLGWQWHSLQFLAWICWEHLTKLERKKPPSLNGYTLYRCSLITLVWIFN